jgi:hypothetical protein
MALPEDDGLHKGIGPLGIRRKEIPGLKQARPGHIRPDEILDIGDGCELKGKRPADDGYNVKQDERAENAAPESRVSCSLIGRGFDGIAGP